MLDVVVAVGLHYYPFGGHWKAAAVAQPCSIWSMLRAGATALDLIMMLVRWTAACRFLLSIAVLHSSLFDEYITFADAVTNG